MRNGAVSPAMTEPPFRIDAAAAERFAADLDRLAPQGSKVGIAVSGGPDSLALLLLASVARPGAIEAATVDHGFRSEAAAEAKIVSGLCEMIGVPHATLKIEWDEKPETAIQERARSERYRLLDLWATERGLYALATAHHLDDQAETFLMRLNRGAGVRGLAGMRPVSPVPAEGSNRPLIRPLLSWRRAELEQVCKTTGVEPASDPSNSDDRYERVRVRQALAEADWLDADAVARSVAHLGSADSALHWAAEREWEDQVRRSAESIVYRPAAPTEIRRRVVVRALAELASEGDEDQLRGTELDRLLAALEHGERATLRGVLCTGGDEWTFMPAPPRKR